MGSHGLQGAIVVLDGWKTKAGIGVGAIAVGGFLYLWFVEEYWGSPETRAKEAMRNREEAERRLKNQKRKGANIPGVGQRVQVAVGYYAGGGLLGLLR